jgi:hypothetical protein
VCELAASPASSSWRLETVAVTALSTGVTTWFYADRGFESASGAGSLEAAEVGGSAVDVRAQLQAYKVSHVRGLTARAEL